MHRLWRWRRPLFLIFLAAAALVAGGIWHLAHQRLPDPHPQDQTAYVYGAGGQLLATYQQQDRTDVPLSAVPRVVVRAVVATEDRHFFTEGAINPISIARALVDDMLGHGGLQGGSTITQQYVKQAYLTPRRTIGRKLREAMIAVELDRRYSKDRILDDYLNTIYFGRGAYGIAAAARAYFGEPVQRLGLAQASLLAGLIREPDIADPAIDPAVARTNQSDTLASMVQLKEISRGQAARVEATPFSRYVIRPSSASGPSVTAVPGVQYFLAAVHAQLVADFGAAEVATGGLRVTTTLDPALQADAYRAVYGTGPNALDPSRGDPSAALVSVDDRGRVAALVGGQDYATSEVDLALGAAGGGSGRQAGSTFKAFLLAYLVQHGYSVESTFPAPPQIVIPYGAKGGKTWTVGNFEGEAGSTTTSVVQATAQSINTVYAQLVERLGPQSLITESERMGIPSSIYDGAYPALVLGTRSVSPLEMASAYSTFAAGGVYHSPVLITRVVDSRGRVLPLPTQTVHRVLSPAQDAVVDYVLQQVVLNGTGGAAGGIGTPVAGKTGTTENSDDAWFVGYTPAVTTAVWMGYTKGELPMVDFRGLTSVQGGTIPAAIWHDAMAAMVQSDPHLGGAFPVPQSLGGTILTPPTNVQFPEGLGTTTTTVPPTTTTVPAPTTTTPATVPTTVPATTPQPATTTTLPAPSTTASTTTVPPSTTAPATTAKPGSG